VNRAAKLVTAVNPGLGYKKNPPSALTCSSTRRKAG